MIKNIFYRISIFTVFVLCFYGSFGQSRFANYTFDSTSTYKIKLLDQTEFVCKFLQKDSVSIVVKTNSIPKIELPISKIIGIETIDSINLKRGQYWFQNPSSTRYFIGSSAFNLKKGEAYYQNTYLLGSSFNVGLNDNFSIGGGFELFSILMDSRSPIFFINSKVGIELKKNLHSSMGVFYGIIPEGESGNTYNTINGMGMLYTNLTYGSTNDNITFGIGKGLFYNKLSESFILNISGMTRVSKRLALVSENWISYTNQYSRYFSYGIRIMGNKFALDLALINSLDIYKGGIITGIPYIDFQVKF